MFSSISDFLESVGQIIPRVKNIKPYQKAIKFIWGSKVKILGPGVTIVWPVSTEITILPVNRQTISLGYQTLTTKDGKSIVVSAALQHHINDIEKYVLENSEPEETIIEAASSIFRNFIASNTLEEILRNISSGETNKTMSDKAREELLEFGINVEFFRLTDVSPTRVITLANPTNE